jgi:hypothetical protein
MGKINIRLLVLGGVVAGVVLFIVDAVVNGVFLVQEWNDAMAALQKPTITEGLGNFIFFALLSLIVGLTTMWVYVGIRPRFGPGPKSAIYAGLAVWLAAYLVPNAFVSQVGLVPARIAWAGIIVGLIEVPVASILGAYFYQEEPTAT